LTDRPVSILSKGTAEDKPRCNLDGASDAVVKDECLVGRSNRLTELLHRPSPPGNDFVLGHRMAALGNPKSNTLNVCLWIISSDKEQLDEETCFSRASQYVDLAWMGHYGLEAEASICGYTVLPALICNLLRFSRSLVI